MKYLLEIKNRLALLVVAWLSTWLISYYYKETLLFVLVQQYTATGIKESMNISYFIFTDVTEILSVYLNLIMFLSFQVFYVCLLYHFFLFISPALFYAEYTFCRFGVKILSIAWGASIVLSTYLLIPITWQFFLSFQSLNLKNSFNLHFEARLKEYLHFYVSSYFMYLFYFQFFAILLLILNHANLSIEKLKEFRKFNYYCFIIMSTILTSSEVLNQLCMGLVIIILYELTLFIYLLRNHC